MASAHLEKYIPPVGHLCRTECETKETARRIAANLQGGEVLSLEGPLGAGKTCFVKGLAEGLGMETSGVSSPTFTLVHEYEGGRLPLIHMDLYRLDSEEELAALGIDDLITRDAVAAIEWGDKFPDALPLGTVRLVFSIEGDSRKITIAP